MPVRYALDVETYSEADLKLTGAYAYARHPSTRCLCVSLRSRDADIRWREGDPVPQLPEGFEVQGWNVSSFDYHIWNEILVPGFGFPALTQDRVFDTMHLAAQYNMPLGLEDAAAFLGGAQKDKAGHALMLKMCRPAPKTKTHDDPLRFHTPENLDRLLAYCAQDTAAEAGIAARLRPLFPIERRVEQATIRANDRGFRVDRVLVQRLNDAVAYFVGTKRDEYMALTGTDSVTKLEDLRRFLLYSGVPMDKLTSLDKEAVQNLLAGDLSEPARQALTLRLVLGKSSLSKFTRLLASSEATGRAHGLLQYCGATQTRRWAGRGIQIQNLPKGIISYKAKGEEDLVHRYQAAIHAAKTYSPAEFVLWCDLEYGEDSVMEVAAALIRPCFVADPGKILHVCDYNAVEARVLSWLAGNEVMLQGFRDGKDPYKVMASVMYAVRYEEVTSAQRQVGKAVVLGAGYGLGWRKFVEYCAGLHIDMDADNAQRIITTFRTTMPAIPAFWYACDRAAKHVIRYGGREVVGRIAFEFTGKHMRLILPSGHPLYYLDAALKLVPSPFREGEMVEAITFMCPGESGRMERLKTYGGGLAQAATQAASRDLMADAWLKLEEDPSVEILTSVHDELVAQTDAGRLDNVLQAAMARLPAWAKGLPMKSAEYTSPFYRK